jgi:AcrR family transcriptional regulator
MNKYSYNMNLRFITVFSDWFKIQTHILDFEQSGLVTRTFRRLDPHRQQAIIHAILEEAVDKGPASLNIKEVARRAEVSVGSLYQYFTNRQGLLDFAIELNVRYMMDAFKEFQPYLVEAPLHEALSLYLSSGIEWGQAEMGLVRFFGRAAYQGDPGLAERVVRPVAVVMRETIHLMLTQAAARGELRPDIDIEATTRVLNALTIVFGDSQLFPYLNTYFQLIDENNPFDRIANALIALVIKGLYIETELR